MGGWVFFERWPDPRQWAAEPLQTRLSAGTSPRPIITFLMLHRTLRPGYDYLLKHKLSSIWREMTDSPLARDLAKQTSKDHKHHLAAVSTPNGCCFNSAWSMNCPARAARSRSPNGWPKPATVATGGPRRTRPGCSGRWARPHHPAPAPPHLRHRPVQRRRLVAR
jgi:hypothetical protein